MPMRDPAPWRCVLTDWSKPPVPMEWEADLGGEGALCVGTLGDGFGWYVRESWKALDRKDRFARGIAPTLDDAKAAVEAAWKAGPFKRRHTRPAR